MWTAHCHKIKSYNPVMPKHRRKDLLEEWWKWPVWRLNGWSIKQIQAFLKHHWKNKSDERYQSSNTGGKSTTFMALQLLCAVTAPLTNRSSSSHLSCTGKIKLSQMEMHSWQTDYAMCPRFTHCLPMGCILGTVMPTEVCFKYNHYLAPG